MNTNTTSRSASEVQRDIWRMEDIESDVIAGSASEDVQLLWRLLMDARRVQRRDRSGRLRGSNGQRWIKETKQ